VDGRVGAENDKEFWTWREDPKPQGERALVEATPVLAASTWKRRRLATRFRARIGMAAGKKGFRSSRFSFRFWSPFRL